MPIVSINLTLDWTSYLEASLLFPTSVKLNMRLKLADLALSMQTSEGGQAWDLEISVQKSTYSLTICRLFRGMTNLSAACFLVSLVPFALVRLTFTSARPHVDWPCISMSNEVSHSPLSFWRLKPLSVLHLFTSVWRRPFVHRSRYWLHSHDEVNKRYCHINWVWATPWWRRFLELDIPGFGSVVLGSNLASLDALHTTAASWDAGKYLGLL